MCQCRITPCAGCHWQDDVLSAPSTAAPDQDARLAAIFPRLLTVAVGLVAVVAYGILVGWLP